MNAPRSRASPLSSSPAETYEHYLGPAIAHPFTRVLLEYASPRAGERVLDVACGTGSVARHVAPLVGSSGKVVALDVAFSLADANELRALLSDAGFQNIDVAARSLDVQLATPERFVELTVLGAATSIPAFAQLDASARSALVTAVADETQSVAERYRDGDRLTFPMSTHIATAHTRPAG